MPQKWWKKMKNDKDDWNANDMMIRFGSLKQRPWDYWKSTPCLAMNAIGFLMLELGWYITGLITLRFIVQLTASSFTRYQILTSFIPLYNLSLLDNIYHYLIRSSITSHHDAILDNNPPPPIIWQRPSLFDNIASLRGNILHYLTTPSIIWQYCSFHDNIPH